MFGKGGFGGEVPRFGVPSTPPVTAAAQPASGPAAEPSSSTVSTVAVPGIGLAGSPPGVRAAGDDQVVVGRNLTFHGAISPCDHLVVGGRVVAEVAHCRTMDIAPDGTFEGSALADDADIAGAFEGELTVTGELRIRATGRVRGRIAYGSLAVEPGGLLLGVVEHTADAPRPQPRPVVLPLRRSLENTRHDR